MATAPGQLCATMDKNALPFHIDHSELPPEGPGPSLAHALLPGLFCRRSLRSLPPSRGSGKPGVTAQTGVPGGPGQSFRMYHFLH